MGIICSLESVSFPLKEKQENKGLNFCSHSSLVRGSVRGSVAYAEDVSFCLKESYISLVDALEEHFEEKYKELLRFEEYCRMECDDASKVDDEDVEDFKAQQPQEFINEMTKQNEQNKSLKPEDEEGEENDEEFSEEKCTYNFHCSNSSTNSSTNGSTITTFTFNKVEQEEECFLFGTLNVFENKCSTPKVECKAQCYNIIPFIAITPPQSNPQCLANTTTTTGIIKDRSTENCISVKCCHIDKNLLLPPLDYEYS
ncbi:hypothetical protein ABK040_003555 [Willaertia magna]